MVETIKKEDNKESLNDGLVKSRLQFEEMDKLFMNDKISTEKFKKYIDEIENEVDNKESEEELKETLGL